MSPLYTTRVRDEATESLRACSPLLYQNGNMFNIPGSLVLADGTLYIAPFYLPEPMTMTGLGYLITINGSYTADNNNRLGLYTSDGTNLNLVASCANDGNLWQPGSVGGKQTAFSAPYAAAAGWYYVGNLYNTSAQTTAPGVGRHNSVSGGISGAWGNDSIIHGTVAAQTDLPAQQAIAGLTVGTQFHWWGAY